MTYKMKESETIEFKSSLSQLKKAIISIVAILNKHQKGRLIFGIKDDGNAVGVDIGRTTLRDISRAISEHIEPKIYPEIKEKLIEGKKCVVIDFSGEDIPYFAYGRAYKRVSDEDRVLTKRELEEIILYNNKNKLRWDNQTNKIFSLSDISTEKVKKYVKAIGLEYHTKKSALEKLNLIREGELTNSSILLFGKNPAKYFNLLNLRCAVFPGLDKSQRYIDAKDYYGDLFELIDFAEKYILEHINIGMRIEGLRRVDVPEIHKEAIREAIINAFCHRDYSIPQEVQIAIFKDRVEILSPGKLYGGLKIKDILSKSVSERRNELIADIFHRINYIEKWGTGINKIIKLEPSTRFEEIADFFMVTFKRKDALKTSKKIVELIKENKNIPFNELLEKVGSKLAEKVGSKLAENQLKILLLIEENPRISKKKMAEILKISTTAVDNNINKLKAYNLIERIGPDKGGYWKVIDENE